MHCDYNRPHTPTNAHYLHKITHNPCPVHELSHMFQQQIATFLGDISHKRILHLIYEYRMLGNTYATCEVFAGGAEI
jgi:hypothetical protein